MATRAGAIGNLPWVRGTSFPGVKMAPRGAQHKEAITAELQMQMKNLGIKKFIETYGSSTFQSISPVVTGGIIGYEASKFAFPTDEKDKEQEVSTQVEEQPPKLPEEPPKGPDIGTELATEAAIKTTEKLLEKKDKPEFGKLTKTEIQTAKALKEGKPDFYSRVVESIKNAKPDKLTKTKWKSYIESTKDEMDYLGLTEFLQGNESITKKELLKFVEEKNIAPNITVRSIPKDQMNPLYERYSLGGKQEHIVFQIGFDPAEDDRSVQYREPHFVGYSPEYADDAFAHARVQVGFDEGFSVKYDDLSSEVIDKLKNTQIIDEIQSQWLQTGRNKGFVSDWNIIESDNLIKFLNKNNIKYEIRKDYIEDGHTAIKIYKKDPSDPTYNERRDFSLVDFNPKTFPGARYVFNPRGKFETILRKDKPIYKDQYLKETVWDDDQTLEERKASDTKYLINKGALPDFPIKESTKWVELVLTKLIEKAILDGRDSIAITNGQIQYNRYPEMEEKKRQGLKKFYDAVVIDGSLEKKFADKYNVELERINITEGEASNELQDIHLDNQIKRAQDDGFVLKKVGLQFLWDRTKDTAIPGHAALYSDAGVGQGRDYIENYLSQYQVEEDTDEAWNKIRNNEVYIWIKEREISPNRIGWELPIVPVNDAHTTVVSTTEMQQHLETSSNQDLEIYSLYLKGIEPPQGEEINPEQLIFMKFPKKLQKERLSKPIKLSKAKQQTERLFA